MGETIRVVFFDLGDTLGTPLLSPPPIRLVGFEVFPFSKKVLTELSGQGLRLGVISNTGDDDGTKVNAILSNVGLLSFFDRTLLIYSKDVGLTKSSTAIFRLGAKRAGLEDALGACLFVGEDAQERAVALDAGWRVAPHPLLAAEVIDGQSLSFVRIGVPQRHAATGWRQALAATPIVPLHTTGPGGTTVYAVTSQRTMATLANMKFDVGVLGAPDTPLRHDLYILRDDRAERTGFMSSSGEAMRLFGNQNDARLVVASTDEGLVVALPPDRKLDDLHFEHVSHGHTVKLVPDPSLLVLLAHAPLVRSAGFAFADSTGLAVNEIAALNAITDAMMVERAERYGGIRPISDSSPRSIASRNIYHDDNAVAVDLLAKDLQAVGKGKLTVRLHRFTQDGRQLYNVEAELSGSSPEIVLVTAHLDSTAMTAPHYEARRDPAPGVDDDASGTAAVVSIAECIVELARDRPPARTLRFVLFNAEEYGLVGSKVYARQQKLAGAQIAAVLQMDMIGYHTVPPASWEIHAGNTVSGEVEKRSAELAELARQLSTQVAPDLNSPQIYTSAVPDGDPAEGRSDHAPFQDRGYAAIVASEDFFAGPGPDAPPEQHNPNYHAPGDRQINGKYAAGIARVIGATAWVLARSAPEQSFVARAAAARAPQTHNSIATMGGRTMPRELKSREFDSRRHNSSHFGRMLRAVTRNALTAAVPPSTNPMTASPVRVEAAPATGAERSYVERAMTYAQKHQSDFGFGPSDPVEYVPDPTVQRTSSGAAAVHLQQYYRGLPVFQMARTVNFAPGGEVREAKGDTAGLAAGLETQPVLDVASAVIAAAKHLAATAGEKQTDDYGQSFEAPGIELKDYRPEVEASFPLPSRPTVLSKGPFQNPIPAYLLVFVHPERPRLAWHATLTLPDYVDQFIAIVAADTQEGEILYFKSTMHLALGKGSVFETSPGSQPRSLDFPRPITDYPISPSTPLVGFPPDWIDGQETSGNSVKVTLNGRTMRGNLVNGKMEFVPADGDDQNILNLFYFCNYMHDFLYMLGFDEAAGNFQNVNLTHTGLGGDGVQALIFNVPIRGTASMATPPDGRSPILQSGTFRVNATTFRHTCLDADVIFHEYVHGLSNRLVGGRINQHALSEPQSAGMGEGWSDFYALTIQNFARNQEKFVTGDWVTGRPGGIRSAPYDQNYPLKYGDLAGQTDEHNVGEVWCAALMQMARNLRRALNSDKDGYRLAWTIVTDGMKLIQANPSFIDARDGILHALDDLKSTGRLPPSVHEKARRACWDAFARFGIGFRAQSLGADLDGIIADESLPPDLAPVG